jgi:hypothetical protein
VRDLAVLFLHLLTTVARLAGPGGGASPKVRPLIGALVDARFERERQPYRHMNGAGCTRRVPGICPVAIVRERIATHQIGNSWLGCLSAPR